MKKVLAMFTIFLSLMAQEAPYQEEVYESVNSDIEKNNENLITIFSQIENNETKKTMYQYTYSIFNLKAHHTNYLLPLSVRVNGDYNDPTKDRAMHATEIEFQVSVKYDFLPNLLGLNELYSVAYTQHSCWQYYVGDAYFRSSDYNPEFYITFPIHTEYFKAFKLSVAHMSNGLGVPQERAWNYSALSFYFQYKSLFAELMVWQRLPDNYDYNPELIDTMGHGHLKLLYPYKKNLFSLLLRDNFKGKGAIDASYSYPLFSDSLFLYIKGFAGYGETMSSYAGNSDYAGKTSLKDDYVEKIGIGVSLSR